MGVVYLAEKPDAARQVAIKVIRSGADSAEVLRRFRQERAILELLDAEYTSRIFDASTTDDDSPYFVMEYVDGEPITSFADTRRFDCRARLSLFSRVCEAVHSAHQKGIIHRDLKPSNVLVTEVSGRAVPKIIDFGLAKLLPAAGRELGDLTLHEQVLGTPGYLSPEMAVPASLPDVRSDVYSLGAILYELLTGDAPHDHAVLNKQSLEEMLRQIRESDPPLPSVRVASLDPGSDVPGLRRETSPSSLAARLHGELDWIVMRALEKEQPRRYGSVGAFQADIERFLANEPIVAAPPSGIYRMRKFVRRHRVGVAIALIGFLALLDFAGTMTVQARRIARERNRAEHVSQFLKELLSASGPNDELGQVLTAREFLDRGAERVTREFADEPEVRAELMDAIGSVYRDQADYRKAEQFFNASLDIRKQVLGSDDPDTLQTMHGLAIVYQREGKIAEAEQLDRDALATQRRVLGADHRDTILSMNSLATVLMSQGRFEEAEVLYREGLERGRRVLGDDDPATLLCLTNLGNAVGAQGRTGEKAEIFRESYESQKRTLTENHPHTLTALNNLADALRDLGRFDEAERLHREVLERRRRVLGENHPDTIFSMYSLAQVAARKGQHEVAMRWLRDAVEHGLGIADEMANDPQLASLRADPEFQALVLKARGNPIR